jgi:hypothetical protein
MRLALLNMSGAASLSPEPPPRRPAASFPVCPYDCFAESTVGAIKGFAAGSVWGAYSLYQNIRSPPAARTAAPAFYPASRPFSSPIRASVDALLLSPRIQVSSSRTQRQRLRQHRHLLTCVCVLSVMQLVSPAFIYPVKFAALLSVYRFLCCAGCHLSTLSAHTQASPSPSLLSMLLTPTAAAALSGVVVSLPHLSPRITLAHAAGCAAIAATVTLGWEAGTAIETNWSRRRTWTLDGGAPADRGVQGLRGMHTMRAELSEPATAVAVHREKVAAADSRLRPTADEHG